VCRCARLPRGRLARERTRSRRALAGRAPLSSFRRARLAPARTSLSLLPWCPVPVLLQAGDLSGALEKMLALEKRARLAGDSAATSKVAVEVVRTCWELKALEQLNAHVLILSKRRAQLKQAVADVVKEAMGYVDAMPTREAKLALVTTLRTVADGKIYVEVRTRAAGSRAGARARARARAHPPASAHV
jgi:hypothetical protein